MPRSLDELHILGSKTKERIVRAEQCRPLKSVGVALTGLCHAERPYSMSTSNATRMFAMACVGGRGRVWVDGRWEICRAGESYLCPKGGAHAYETIPGHFWHFVWSLYAAPPHWFQWPVMENRHGGGDHAFALSSSVEGLYREVNGSGEEAFTERWVELIHSYWRSTAEGRADGGRLGMLWEKIDSRLAHPWTLSELAQVAGTSTEHLRRLCHSETGQSPFKYLTWLRMQRADALLQSRRLTVAAVADAVGYSSPFAFSAAFKKWSGHPPTDKFRHFDSSGK